MQNSIKHFDSFATEYDKLSKAHNYWAPEALFGLSYEHENPGQTLLDIGIGTGQSSLLHYKAGLKVVTNSASAIRSVKSLQHAKHIIYQGRKNDPAFIF